MRKRRKRELLAENVSFFIEFRHFFGLSVCISKFMYIFHFRSEKQELRKQIARMASEIAEGVQDQQGDNHPADCGCICDVWGYPVWYE